MTLRVKLALKKNFAEGEIAIFDEISKASIGSFFCGYLKKISTHAKVYTHAAKVLV